MSWEDTPREENGNRPPKARMWLLIVIGLVVSNIVVSLLMDRDSGLGLDELLAVSTGVGAALLVEFGIFRRRNR